ncbi:hypothetical protein BHE74_00033413 [Ensete ventricosum]|nr:hypothetical protein BHE74_00033413 [Ensete ventricosum]
MAAANANLPPASDSINNLIARFSAKGLNLRDLTALSGAHTVGAASCRNFRPHIYGDSNVDPGFAMFRKRICPAAAGVGDSNLTPLDSTSPNRFDVSYYRDLMARRGLLHSDQELFNNGPADGLVRLYSSNGRAFDTDFAAGMVKMGNISPLLGSAGEVEPFSFFGLDGRQQNAVARMTPPQRDAMPPSHESHSHSHSHSFG